MLIPFFKMHAQGNDFVVVDERGIDAKLDWTKLAQEMCALHFGIGADGLVRICEFDQADFQMIIYNSDGSRAKMCGSALRCVVDYESRVLSKSEVLVQTDSGIRKGLIFTDQETRQISVNMGSARVLEEDIHIEGIKGSLIDVGNQHFVSYELDLQTDPHLKYGHIIEHDSRFSEAVNVQFANVLHRDSIRIKIWEASCGATLACGTGATAAVHLGRISGVLGDIVTVIMPGGSVLISIEDDQYWMRGEVHTVFQGDYLWKI